MRDAALATLKAGDVVYLRATLVENFGSDLAVKVKAPNGDTTVQIAPADVINFAPLSFASSGQAVALSLSDFLVR